MSSHEHPNPSHLPAIIAVVAAIALFVVGIRWGTFAAGGSDSSCYLNQSRLFAAGTTHIDEPLVTRAPWPKAEWTFTPAGHIPSPVGAGIIVPMCPPGLPVLMTAARIVPRGEFLVVPLCGALAVWLTFLIGRRIGTVGIGAGAAVLLACSPSVLFQVVQPMTDVPAMAWWLLAAALAIGARGAPRPLAAGLAASLAILTRPNLAPIAGLLAAYVFAEPGIADTERPGESVPMRGLRSAIWFTAGLAPGLALLAILQAKMYGSPLSTGYGAASDLFKAANVGPNLRLYVGWLIETHTTILGLALFAPWLTRRRGEAWLGLGIAIVTLALYLPYFVFGDWTYIRFLLPALPWLIVLSLVTIVQLVDRFVTHRTGAVLVVTVAALGAFWIHVARQRSAFELVRLERHFVDAGTLIASRFAQNTAVLTVRHSGSVHYYARQRTVSWDTLPAGSLDSTLAFLRSQGLRPILLLDTSEEAAFRARFEASSPIGHLDWPPAASAGRTIRVYDPADRGRYFAQ